MNMNQAIRYAPTAGVLELRTLRQKYIYTSNPRLESKLISLPIVTAGLTHGISLAAQLFCSPGDPVVLNAYRWDNYDGIFQDQCQGILHEVDTMDRKLNAFDLMAIIRCVDAIAESKIVLVLNFPLNPLGYTPGETEVLEFAQALQQRASQGRYFVIVCDDAYVGFYHTSQCIQQSIFAYLSHLHENILVVKIDGVSKQDFAWGLRLGFLTLAVHDGTAEVYDYLTAKIIGALRLHVSNVNHAMQLMFLHMYQNPNYELQKQQLMTIVHRKYESLQRAVDQYQPSLNHHYVILPFNSGFFFCLEPRQYSAQKIRRALLVQFKIGVVVLGSILRICYTTVPLSDMEPLIKGLVDVIEHVALST